MTVWVFVLFLLLPSFGGPVRVDFQTTTWEACQKLRKIVQQAYFEDHRGEGTLTECHVDTIGVPMRP